MALLSSKGKEELGVMKKKVEIYCKKKRSKESRLWEQTPVRWEIWEAVECKVEHNMFWNEVKKVWDGVAGECKGIKDGNGEVQRKTDQVQLHKRWRDSGSWWKQVLTKKQK